MKILLMDDEDQVRSVTTRMLEFLGHEVTGVADGGEAVVAYRDALDSGREFDIVILDIIVNSGTGGKEALAELREITPCVHAAASSGFGDETSKTEYARLGFKWFIPKPLTLAELQAVLLDIRRNLNRDN